MISPSWISDFRQLKFDDLLRNGLNQMLITVINLSLILLIRISEKLSSVSVDLRYFPYDRSQLKTDAFPDFHFCSRTRWCRIYGSLLLQCLIAEWKLFALLRMNDVVISSQRYILLLIKNNFLHQALRTGSTTLRPYLSAVCKIFLVTCCVNLTDTTRKYIYSLRHWLLNDTSALDNTTALDNSCVCDHSSVKDVFVVDETSLPCPSLFWAAVPLFIEGLIPTWPSTSQC